MNFFVQVWQIVVKYYPHLLKGIGMTLLISLVGTLIGLVIGLLSKIPILGIIFSILGTVIGLYTLIGIVLSILVFVKVLK